MVVSEIVAELSALGHENIKQTLIRHGAREPLFGVKVGDLQPIRKRIKTDYRLSLDLYATGISDAMYLAGLIADDPRMTPNDLQGWVKAAYWSLLSETTVPSVAAGSPHGWDLALKWIDDDTETIAAAGWSTLSSLVSITPDADLDLPTLEGLLHRIAANLQTERNRVRHIMNGFIIYVGGYVAPLTPAALQAADTIGPVTVDMGDTACKVPSARDYIEKVQTRGVIGKKRKSAKC
jgi:3-methyladenine DNA glycosylase AlkD